MIYNNSEWAWKPLKCCLHDFLLKLLSPCVQEVALEGLLQSVVFGRGRSYSRWPVFKTVCSVLNSSNHHYVFLRAQCGSENKPFVTSSECHWASLTVDLWPASHSTPFSCLSSSDLVKVKQSISLSSKTDSGGMNQANEQKVQAAPSVQYRRLTWRK